MNKILHMLGVLEAAEKPGQIGFANESAFTNTMLSQPLTQYAQGVPIMLPELTALLHFVAPAVPVPRRFEYRKGNKNAAFAMAEGGEDLRALYGEFKQMKADGTIENSKTLSKGFTKLLDKDIIAEDPDAEKRAVAELSALLLRAEIYRAISMLNAVATNTNLTWTPAGSPPAGRDADMDIMTALLSGEASAAVAPNRLLFGQSAWQKRMLSLRSLATAGGFANAGFTEQGLADFLAIDAVKVGRERFANSATKGKDPLVAANTVFGFNAQTSPSTEDPSNIKRFVSGGGFRVHRKDDDPLIRITVSHHSHIVVTSSEGIVKLTIA